MQFFGIRASCRRPVPPDHIRSGRRVYREPCSSPAPCSRSQAASCWSSSLTSTGSATTGSSSARALRNDLLRRIAVPWARGRPYRRAHEGGLSGRRPTHLEADHARPSRSRPSLPARLRHGSQAGLRRRELRSLGSRRSGGRGRPRLLALSSRPLAAAARTAGRDLPSSSTRSMPPATRSPAATWTALTVPANGEGTEISIFIASSTTSGFRG